MATKFFTNEDSNTLFNKLEGVFRHGTHIEEFDTLVGYFHSAGYFKVRPFLEGMSQIRILVGINIDTLTRKYQSQGLLLGTDIDATKQDYLGKLQREIQNVNYSHELEQSILQFIDDINSGKIQIKAHPTRKLHAKIYIFRPKDFNPHSACEVITGSSNLTEAGLGLKANDSNYEFNVSLRDYDDVKFATDEFDKLWKEAVDILPEEISKTKDKTFLKDNFTPFELYIKLLIEYFGKEIEFNPDSIKDLPDGFKRLNYQLDAVQQGYTILEEHNGFFLADVVGLGKTVVAILIARQFFYSNNYLEHVFKILIVIPPALKKQWQETVRKFKLDTFVDYVNNGSLHKIEHPEDYSLVIVDEAHKFRSDKSQGYENLQFVCKTPDCNGKAKKVILVSATPLNNRPDDIRNLVFLFQDKSNSTLGINIGAFFANIGTRYKEIISTNSPGAAADKLYDELRDKIIQPLTVRRTRTDLHNHEVYKQDLQEKGIRFPESGAPQKLLYPLEKPLNQLYDETVEQIKSDGGLQYTRHRVIEFMKPEHRKDYQRPEQFLSLLAANMKSLLVKRLDSSFYAFHRTLTRFVRASKAVLKMVEDDRIIVAPNHRFEEDILEENEDELLKKLEKAQLTDPGIKVLKRNDFKDGFVEGLEEDHAILTQMEQAWRKVVEEEEDPKLDKFLSVLETELLEKNQNPEQKLVIFSESLDTTDYLTKKLKERQFENILSVNSANRSQLRDTIKQNFDANVSPEQQRSDYNIIITTEVLAEGVNLHRANTVLNYDTPWNATRLMQRIGRINRIGTKADKIHVYNFFPTEKVEDDIQLRHRAIVKLQAFHSTLGEDSQIYSTDEQVETFGLFDETQKNADQVDERLEYLMEIRKFRKEFPEEFQRIKKLPLKIRNAVKNEEHQNGTIIYLRSKQQRNAFYEVDRQNELAELSFLQTVSIFKCDSNAQAQPLHGQHYDQVQQAIEHFRQQMAEKIAAEQHHQTLMPQQSRAINYLKALQALPVISDDEKQKLTQIIEIIKLGRFQLLERKINELKKNAKRSALTNAGQLQSLLSIISKYISEKDVEQEKEESDSSPTNQAWDDPPKIIIAQSYV